MTKNIITTLGLVLTTTIILTGCADRGYVSTTVVYDQPPVVVLESRPIMIYPIYRPHYYRPMPPFPMYRPPIHRLPPPIHRIPPTTHPSPQRPPMPFRR